MGIRNSLVCRLKNDHIPLLTFRCWFKRKKKIIFNPLIDMTVDPL